ncbi:MAG TPA: metal-dependent hydrolase [Blastocatellia bacterium]|nr:metal-dependent hydrolase [Blastocatellia bacterium]
MENFAHTLLGLSLAKAGLERATPLATTALVISSNLPDIDNITGLFGGTVSSLNYHRGFTHSFVGLAALAAALALALRFLDRRFRLHRDHRRRPVRALRIFWIAYLGGLGHTYMDFTNNYGVRPLQPFSNRWFYGDIVFVADPWIWLILGSSVVWLTTTNSGRAFSWLVIGVILSLIMALALRGPSEQFAPIPNVARICWFVGLAIIIAGALLGWGRFGEKLALYSLLALGIYYGGMWMAHQSAMRRDLAQAEGYNQIAAWPTPANPALWKSVASREDRLYTSYVDLTDPAALEWAEVPRLDPKFVEALRQSPEARVFLDFSRFAAANVAERPDGYTVTLDDVRFNLRMRAELDPELNVLSTDVRWF